MTGQHGAACECQRLPLCSGPVGGIRHWEPLLLLSRLLQLGALQQRALRLGVRSSLPSRMNLARPAQATGQAPLTASHSTADWVHSHRTVTLCEHNI